MCAVALIVYQTEMRAIIVSDKQQGSSFVDHNAVASSAAAWQGASKVSPVVGDTSLFGFYLQVYKQPKATLEVVKSLFQHMPASPLYLVGSSGYHYDPLVARFGGNRTIHYTYEDINIALPKGGNLTAWFDRIQAAALWCNCTYLVILEDDISIRKPLIQPPEHDVGGVQGHLWSSHWPTALKGNFSTVNWSYESYGTCGGSYVRVEAFLDAYQHINWTKIREMQRYHKIINKFNDATLAVVMMDRGYTLRPWKDLSERGNRWHDETTPLVHQVKQYYNQPLTEQDGPVISEVLNTSDYMIDRRRKIPT